MYLRDRADKDGGCFPSVRTGYDILNYVVATNPHSDHIGGISDLQGTIIFTTDGESISVNANPSEYSPPVVATTVATTQTETKQRYNLCSEHEHKENSLSDLFIGKSDKR